MVKAFDSYPQDHKIMTLRHNLVDASCVVKVLESQLQGHNFESLCVHSFQYLDSLCKIHTFIQSAVNENYIVQILKLLNINLGKIAHIFTKLYSTYSYSLCVVCSLVYTLAYSTIPVCPAGSGPEDTLLSVL